MNDPLALLTVTGVAIAAPSIACLAALKAWLGWLEIRRLRLTREPRMDGRPLSIAKSEIDQLAHRVRRLEAIADGIEF